jgi:hypothetical protein
MEDINVEQIHSTLQAHLADCGAQRVETRNALVALNTKFDNTWAEANRTAWKAVGAIGLSILVAALGLAVQSQSNHVSTAEKTVQVAQTVDQVTAQARREREERDRELLIVLQSMNERLKQQGGGS